MNPRVEAWLRGVLGAYPEKKVAEVVDGWWHYFARLGIDDAHQWTDFEATMRMRVASGCISVVADNAEHRRL